MTINTEKWLLDFVGFYRKLSFFEEHSQLSDEDLAYWIRQIMAQQGMDLNQESCRQDYLVLGCDRKRVWGTAFDAYDFSKAVGIEYGWKLHEDIVNGWASISRGLFRPKDVKATWTSIEKPIQIEFTLASRSYSLEIEPDLISGAS